MKESIKVRLLEKKGVKATRQFYELITMIGLLVTTLALRWELSLLLQYCGIAIAIYGGFETYDILLIKRFGIY